MKRIAPMDCDPGHDHATDLPGQTVCDRTGVPPGWQAV